MNIKDLAMLGISIKAIIDTQLLFEDSFSEEDFKKNIGKAVLDAYKDWNCQFYQCENCGTVISIDEFKSAKCDFECPGDDCNVSLKSYMRIEK